MPQLDKLTFFSQITIVLILLVFFFIFFATVVLPLLYRAQKARLFLSSGLIVNFLFFRNYSDLLKTFEKLGFYNSEFYYSNLFNLSSEIKSIIEKNVEMINKSEQELFTITILATIYTETLISHDFMSGKSFNLDLLKL